MIRPPLLRLRRADLLRLRQVLLLAVGCLLIAGTALLLSSRYLTQEEQARQQASRERQTAEQRLHQSSSEGETVRRNAELFNRLFEQGLLGPEHRLDWVELIRSIQSRLKLSEVDYEFQAQVPLDEKNAPAASGKRYAFYNSRMKLRLKLVQENDIVQFLSLLQGEARALVRVQGCKLSRMNATASPNALEQLQAECELDWITARQADAE